MKPVTQVQENAHRWGQAFSLQHRGWRRSVGQEGLMFIKRMRHDGSPCHETSLRVVNKKPRVRLGGTRGC